MAKDRTELERISTTLHRARLAHKQLALSSARKEALQLDLGGAKELLLAEHEDILELERKSINRLFGEILGTYKDRMDIERQEYMQALLTYRSIGQELELLDYEINLLTDKAADIPHLEKELQELLLLTEKKLQYKSAESEAIITQHNLLIDLSKARTKEIREAMDLCESIKENIKEILIDLRKVSQFGPISPIHGKGRYSSYHKKSYIDASQKLAIKVNHQLHLLQDELSDIYKEHKHGLQITDFELFIDNFYGYLITDWVLQRKLNSAIQGTEIVLDRVHRLAAMLTAELHAEQLRSQDQKTAKHQYITEQANTI